MLTEKIGQSKTNKAFIGYSTGSILPKKTKGKRSQGKTIPVTPKKKSSVTVDDSIIPKLYVALELGKSIIKTEAEIADEVRCVHETHERLVTEKSINEEESDESDAKPAKRYSKCLKEEITRSISEAQSHSEINIDNIEWMSNDDEDKADKDDQDDDDDKSIDIEETNDKRIDLENGDQVMTDAEKNVVEKIEEEKGDEEEEQANDDQAQEDQVEDDIVGTLVTMSQKEKPEVPRSSSSRSLSSNYGKKTKKRRTKETKSSKKSSTLKETSKGNALSKSSKFDKTIHAEESVAKPTKYVIIDTKDNIENDDMVNDVDQLQDDSVPKTDTAPKDDWFTQPLRPPTPDPE
nr:hypothetical protein [Tanacetum cinerariifolium]